MGNQIIAVHAHHLIVVCHRSAQIVLLVTHQTTVDEIATLTGIEMDCLIQIDQRTVEPMHLII